MPVPRSSHAHTVHRPPDLTFEIGVALGLGLLVGLFYVLTTCLKLYPLQILECGLYLFLPLLGISLAAMLGQRRRSIPQDKRPTAAVYITPEKDRAAVKAAAAENGVVLGYTIDREPYVLTDAARTQQAACVGTNGSGKSTLLANIISQDIHRGKGIIIFDGKGDGEFKKLIVHHALRAGRIHQLKIVSPAEPHESVAYNPFWGRPQDCLSRIEMVYGAFGITHEFFGPHQRTFFVNLALVLHHAGHVFNFRDILVMATDKQVQLEQIARAKRRAAHLDAKTRETLRAATKDLLDRMEDTQGREKVQGLLNELMPFIQHPQLEIITGPYTDIVNPGMVLEQNLILYISLNINTMSAPLTTLGKIFLQDLQYMIGRTYENNQVLPGDRPFIGIFLDEFAPFAYRGFEHIIATARGSNTAFLLAVQTDAQLRRSQNRLGTEFMQEVMAEANTKLYLKNLDVESTKRFVSEAAQFATEQYSYRVEQSVLHRLFGIESEPTVLPEGTISQVGAPVPHVRKVAHILQMPTGHVDVLVPSHQVGRRYDHLVVRPPERLPTLGDWQPTPPLKIPKPLDRRAGAYLRVKGMSGPAPKKGAPEMTVPVVHT